MDKLWEEREFRSWLEEQSEGAIVGNVEHDDTCPIARYLNEKTDAIWIVNERRARKNGESFQSDVPMPLWGRLFIYTVDAAKDPNVTREQALDALDNPWV